MKNIVFALSLLVFFKISAQSLEFRVGTQYTKFLNTDSYYIDCHARLSTAYNLDYHLAVGAKKHNLTLQMGFQSYNGVQKQSTGGLGSNFYHVDSFSKAVLNLAILPIQIKWKNGIYTKAGVGLDVLIFSKVHGHSGGWAMNGPSIPTIYYNEDVRQVSKPIVPLLIGELGYALSVGSNTAVTMGYHFSLSLSKEMMFSYALKNMALVGIRYNLK
ncbi:MAG: hypothetical protein RLZZ65_398 [Bacteroidota bacterium]|jgi:hypothetical protein